MWLLIHAGSKAKPIKLVKGAPVDSLMCMLIYVQIIQIYTDLTH